MTVREFNDAERIADVLAQSERHAADSEHLPGIVTDIECSMMRTDRANGVSTAEIADRHDVARDTVRNHVHGRCSHPKDGDER